MIRNVLRRFLSLSLTLITIISLIPAFEITVAAADVTGLTVEGAKLSSTGDGTWKANGTSVNGSVTGQAEGTCSAAASKSGTLTITNDKGSAAKLSFDYTLTLSGGSATVGGTAVTRNGSYSSDIAAGGTVDISITSAVGNSTTSIDITNVQLVADSQVTTTFLIAENGTYTVDGVQVNAETPPHRVRL